MPNKKENNPKSDEEQSFEREFSKLKLSAEHGLPFADEKQQQDPEPETEEVFLARMREFEEAMDNPDERTIREVLENPTFPKGENLTDAQISSALEMITTMLANEGIELAVLHPTPEREIYRFMTEELLDEEFGATGAGGMTTHYIYEEFYPNHTEDIKSAVIDVLRFICRDEDSFLPWNIACDVRFHGELISQKEFEANLALHREIFEGMHFVGVDSFEIDINDDIAHAKVDFRYFLDESSNAPGEKTTQAEFYFELGFEIFELNRLVIEQFGIR